MATKPKKAAPVLNLALLAAIGAATAVAPGYKNVPHADIDALGPLVEKNPDPQFADAAGNPAVRLSAQGATFLQANAEAVAAAVAAEAAKPAAAATDGAGVGNAEAAKPVYKVMAFALPEAKRAGGGGGARPEVYPFSTLNVGEAFFVAATADKPNPGKTFASTVASATQRYAKDDTTKQQYLNRKQRLVYPKIQERKFEIRSLDDGAPFGFPGVKGAVVGRTL